MAAFNLTAVLQLQAPTNTQQVVSQIQKGLKGVNVKLNVQADTRAVAAVNKQLGGVNKAAKNSSRSINTLNRNLSEAARRFSVITIATGSFIAFARAIKNSIGAAVQFEREMVKISQVTGTSVGQLHGLAKTVTELSTGLGVANQSLLETSRILAQAGLSAMKTRQALEVLANTTLAPSFDNIIDTTEGAIAILNQFGRAASKTGQDIKFLEQSLDAINAVSKRFAVESADLITAIRRTGGVFQAAGGNLKELIALFTSVRQTTRESAETIATGFRTIFTRLQRSETIDALDALGISLNDLEGKFVGPMRAIELLSSGLAGLDTRDVRFNEIVEQLGGFRQIGKVIPLLKQMSVTQAALSVANNSSGSSARDAQLAQQSLAVSFQKVGEQFDSMIRKFSSSDTFRGLADTVLSLATSFLKFGKILSDVLPQLMALAAIKIGQNLAPGLMSMMGGGSRRKSMGGRIHGYAKGGWVPGQGSGDTVPAMLTPGEFVIKKSSAQKMGPATLEAMNNNRFKVGDKVTKPRNPRSKIEAAQQAADGKEFKKDITLTSDAGAVRDSILSLTKSDGAVDVGGAFLQPAYAIKDTLNAKGDGEAVRTRVWDSIKKTHGKKWTKKEAAANLADFSQKQPADGFDFDVNIHSGSTTTFEANKFKEGMNESIIAAGAKLAPANMPVNTTKMKSALENANIEQIEGGIFESWLAGMSTKPFDEAQPKVDANDTWDFKQGLGSDLGDFFGIDGGIPTDAKRTFNDESVSLIAKKAAADMLSELNIQNTVDEMGIRKTTPAQGKKPKKPKEAAKGGPVKFGGGGLAKFGGGGVTPKKAAKKKTASGSVPHKKSGVNQPTLSANEIELMVAQMNNRSMPKGVKAAAVGDSGRKLSRSEIAKLRGAQLEQLGLKPQKKASGGQIDTVPALLTPGEFVVQKSAAQSIGYSNLASMNKTGVAKFAKGGGVGVGIQRFGIGGGVLQSSVLTASDPLADIRAQTQLTKKDMAMLGEAAKTNAGAFKTLVGQLQGIDIDSAEAALNFFARNMTATADEAAVLQGAQQAAIDSARGYATTAKPPQQPGPSKGVGGQSESRIMPKRSGDEMAELIQQADAVAKEFEVMGEQTSAGQKAMLAFKQAILDGKTEAEALTAGMDAGQKQVAELDAEMADLLEQYAKGAIKEKELNKATEELKKKRKAIPGAPGGPPAPPSGGGGGVANPFRRMQKGADLMGKKFNKFGKGMGKLSSGLSKAGGALGGLASAALGVMFMMGTLMEQFGRGSELEKERQQAGMAAITTHIALGAQMLSFAAVMAAATVGMGAKLALDGPALAAKLFGTAADITEGVASTGAAVADTGEAVATGAVTLALGPFALAVLAAVAALAILVAALAVVAAVFVGSFLYSLYKSAAAAKGFEQAVRKANEAGDKEKEKLNDPTGASGVASESKFVTARVDAAVADFNRIMIEATKYGRAQEEAASMTGQILTSAIWNTSTSMMALGAVFDWLGSEAEELVVLTDAIEADIIANEKHALVVAAISKDYATSTYRAIKATNDFTISMEKAERNNLDATQKMSIMGQATTNMINTFKANEARVGGNDDKIAKLKADLVEGEILTRGGSETGRGTGADGAITDADRDNLKQLKELEKQKIEFMEANNKLLAETFKKEHDIRANMQESLSSFINEAGEGRGRGAGVDLADASLAGNFDAIKNANAEVAKAHADGLKSLNEVITFRYKRLIKAARDADDDAQVSNLEQQERLEKEIAEKTLERNTLAAAQGVLKMEKSSILARVADLQKRKAIMEVNTTLKGFNNMLLGATRTAKLFAQADNAIALASGEAPEAAISDTSILELPFEQIDPQLLNNKLQEAVDMITAGVDRNPLSMTAVDNAIIQRANNMRDTITNAGTVLALLPEAMEDLVDPKNLTNLISTTQGKDAANAVFDKINSAMSNVLTGGTADGMKTQLGTLVHDRIQQLLKDGGTITFEDVQSIQDDIRDLTEEQRAAMIRVIEIKNEYIQKLDSVNTAIISAQQKYADATARVVDVQERAADRMAQATGGRGRRDRDDREQGRRRAASERLGVTARTQGAVAGNVGLTAAALTSMEADALTEAETADAGGPKEEVTAANDAAARLSAGANQARKELERLADQSARASDVMADIKDEQAKRKQLQSIGEDLAFGSDEQRKGIAKGFMDLRTALSQGSMRGATDEQRAGIKSTLDSLSDVVIGDTGKTGKEIKAGMQADEIMRLTGNRQLAQASFDQAMAGSKEEQLLNELAAIGAQEVAAAKALADNALSQVTLLQGIKKAIIDGFNADNATAQAEATVADKPVKDALDAQIDKLGERLIKVDEGLLKYAESIKQLDDVLKIYKTMLQGLNEAMAVLQGDKRTDAVRNQQILGREDDPNTVGIDESSPGLAEAHRKGRANFMAEKMNVRNDDGETMEMKKFNKDAAGKITVNTAGFEEAFDNAGTTEEKAEIKRQYQMSLTSLRTFNQGMANAAVALKGGTGNPNVQKIKDQFNQPDGANADIDFGDAMLEADQAIIKTNDAAIKVQTATMRVGGVVSIDGKNVVIKGTDENGNPASRPVKLDAQMVDNFNARGGMVYAANGGSIFQPKGTDTVPAMLTPGEFVIKKSSVDKIGKGNLAALNNGYANGGLVQYRMFGGMLDILGGFAADKLKDLKKVGIKSALSGLLNQEESDFNPERTEIASRFPSATPLSGSLNQEEPDFNPGRTEEEQRFGGRFADGSPRRFAEEPKGPPSIASRFPALTPLQISQTPEAQSMQRQQKEREAKQFEMDLQISRRTANIDKFFEEEQQRATEAGPAKFGSVEEAQKSLKNQRAGSTVHQTPGAMMVKQLGKFASSNEVQGLARMPGISPLGEIQAGTKFISGRDELEKLSEPKKKGPSLLADIVQDKRTEYRAGGGPISLPPEGFYTQKIIQGSQDPKIMRSALEEAFPGGDGTEHFKALRRLSKRGMIGPENIASSVPFENFMSELKKSGKQQITDWNPARPGIVPFDPSISKWMLKEAQAINAGGNQFTVHSQRIGTESMTKIEAAKARLGDLSGGIDAVTASAPKYDAGSDGGEKLPFLIFNKMGLTDNDAHNVFTTAGLLSTGVKLAKNLQVSKLNEMNKDAKRLANAPPNGGGLAGDLGDDILGLQQQFADADAAAAQAGPQAAPQGPRTKVTQETIDNMVPGAIKDTIKKDYKDLMDAKILQMAAGGSVPSQDTVPAMLTPGEFVMSANAVKKHGIGYMKNLNRGRVPGFNKGGIVGRGNVSYLQNGGQPSGGGGVLALDASNVQGVLDEFNTEFGSHIDSLIGQFSTFNESASGLALAITAGMDVRLKLSGELTTVVKLNGDQAEHVKTALADAVVPVIIEHVSSQIEIKFDELKNSP
jgi:hypothetical protein